MLTKEQIDAELERLIQARQVLDRLPVDDYEDGNLLLIQKQFTAGGRIYTYAAVRVVGRWYLTGQSSPRGAMRWDDLMRFLGADQEKVRLSIWWASEMVEVDSPNPVGKEELPPHPAWRGERIVDISQVADVYNDGQMPPMSDVYGETWRQG